MTKYNLTPEIQTHPSFTKKITNAKEGHGGFQIKEAIIRLREGVVGIGQCHGSQAAQTLFLFQVLRLHPLFVRAYVFDTSIFNSFPIFSYIQASELVVHHALLFMAVIFRSGGCQWERAECYQNGTEYFLVGRDSSVSTSCSDAQTRKATRFDLKLLLLARMPTSAARRMRVGWPQPKDGDLWLSQGF
ncbi:hypothetical protein Gohar_012005 [Gossypium harknessii]|uniref:Uncharacterized protein n=1 Tax=Gossypium harknessii TaxID=34285 RepID=A0A7J9GVQ6_9ROSI|nr:hypothetical protein [Gossypium harknessii]